MPRRQSRRAEFFVLLLRMLQNEQADAGIDRLDTFADTEGRRLAAMPASAGRLGRGLRASAKGASVSGVIESH